MLKVSHLSFAYEQYGTGPNAQVLKDVSFCLNEGETLVVLGAPDSGKSTLARIICNLLPRFIAGTISGDLSIDGESIGQRAPWDLTDKVTLVGQNPQEQLLMTTCADEVAFPLESLGMERTILVKRVHKALRDWGLEEMADVNPQEMSGGERKRLLLAVADAIDAPLWIMDEPFDDLDEHWRSQLLKRLLRKETAVLLFGSRYIDEFRGSFDSYAMLSDGVLTFGEEESIVLAYDKECDARFSPGVGEISIGSVHRFAGKGLEIVHPRKSVNSTPFSLQVKEFHVESGEIVALVGPNGSGKSTLSRVLCGLDPSVAGTLHIDGVAKDQIALRTQVGYLFQNPDYGIFLPTVRDELGWSLRHDSHLSIQVQEKMIHSSAELFHLDCDDNPTMMGYGAKKHLQAAVYHLLERPFLIIDELDSGVTYSAAFEIISLLRMKGAGIVIITHDRSFARNLAQRQYTIIDGEVRETEVGA